MTLIAPFSRRGYRLDVSASDRTNGVLVFRSIELSAGPEGRPALKSVLRLERPHRAKFRLIRTLTALDGQLATMTAEGDEPEALLDAVERVEPDRHFHRTDAGLIARSYRAQVWVADASSRGSAWRAAAPLLTKAEARVGPLTMRAIDGDGWGCDIRLTARDDVSIELPTDFLAVLGWGWRPIRPAESKTWQGRVSVARRGRKRTAALEAHLNAAVAHIAATLGASPTRYHERHRAARWRAAFQRSIPLLFICGTVAGFVVAVTYLPRFPLLHPLLNHLGILAVAVFVMMDKSYRVEIPPPPKPLDPMAWEAAAGELSTVR